MTESGISKVVPATQIEALFKNFKEKAPSYLTSRKAGFILYPKDSRPALPVLNQLITGVGYTRRTARRKKRGLKSIPIVSVSPKGPTTIDIADEDDNPPLLPLVGAKRKYSRRGQKGKQKEVTTIAIPDSQPSPRPPPPAAAARTNVITRRPGTKKFATLKEGHAETKRIFEEAGGVTAGPGRKKSNPGRLTWAQARALAYGKEALPRAPVRPVDKQKQGAKRKRDLPPEDTPIHPDVGKSREQRLQESVRRVGQSQQANRQAVGAGKRPSKFPKYVKVADRNPVPIPRAPLNKRAQQVAVDSRYKIGGGVGRGLVDWTKYLDENS